MDLGAYLQIEDLEDILKDNDIEIPRLRGLRLMKYESPITEDEFKEMYEYAEFEAVEDAVESKFNCDAIFRICSNETDKVMEKFMEFERDEKGKLNHFKPLKIYWDRFNEFERKCVDELLDRRKRNIKKQYEMWNKYCGKDDVLYIHARIGSANWSDWNCDNTVKNQPWYLDHCDDSYDCTYADIYAKVDLKKLKKRIAEKGSNNE